MWEDGTDHPDLRRRRPTMNSTTNSPSTSMRSLERAIDVLEVLDGSRHALRLSEIARRAGLPVATTQRILGVLESRGRVERAAGGYRPGVGLLFGEIGSSSCRERV